MHKWRITLFSILSAALALAQTRVDLSVQSNADFSRANSTKPAKVGTILPVTCTTGDVFFKSDATAGQNLYLCASLNTWTQLTSGSGGGGGGGTTAPVTSTSALTDLIVSKTGSNTLSIASSCSATAPCNVRFGSRTVSVNTPATATVPSGANVIGVAYIYLSSQGQITVGNSMGVTCSGCTALNGITQFPADSIPLFTWSVTGGVWDSTGGVDVRAFLSNKSIIAGTGIITADAAGQTAVSVDTTAVAAVLTPNFAVRVSVPASATAACTPGNYAADSSFLYQCVSANTWLRVALTTWP
jgi:hypothetical protein